MICELAPAPAANDFKQVDRQTGAGAGVRGPDALRRQPVVAQRDQIL